MLVREALVAAVAWALPSADPGARAPRATWIIDSVDHLSRFLDRPADLAREAEDVVARRRPAGAGALVAERNALLVGLTTILGSLSDALDCAWGLATRLLAEVIAEQTLSPFGQLPPRPACSDVMATAPAGCC